MRRLRISVHQGPRSDHLVDVEPGTVPAAQSSERGIRDTGHGGEYDRRPHGEWAEFEGATEALGR